MIWITSNTIYLPGLISNGLFVFSAKIVLFFKQIGVRRIRGTNYPKIFYTNH